MTRPSKSKRHPNIHFCGNPGTGKTSLATKVSEKFQSFDYLDLGKEGKTRDCITGHDDDLECDILDYEKLHDTLVPDMEQGGKIIDWIHADFWDPIDLVHLVVILTCDNTVLFDRYKARGYNSKKIEQNLDSEIMQEIISETKEYYQGDDEDDDEVPGPAIMVLNGDAEDDMTRNLDAISTWIEKWYEDDAAA